jgi:hypothetical protein
MFLIVGEIDTTAKDVYLKRMGFFPCRGWQDLISEGLLG